MCRPPGEAKADHRMPSHLANNLSPFPAVSGQLWKSQKLRKQHYGIEPAAEEVTAVSNDMIWTRDNE